MLPYLFHLDLLTPQDASGLNYGQQCYEGLKACRHPLDSRITIFRPSQNALRMQNSARTNSLPVVPKSLFLRCVHAAVSLNAEYVPPHATGAAMYIRPLLFGSGAQLALTPPEEYLFAVFCLPVGVYHGSHSIDALVLEDFDRAAPRGVGGSKIGGNYAPVFRFSQKAKNEGFGITLHLDSATRSEIDEFSTSGFIGVKRQVGIEVVETHEHSETGLWRQNHAYSAFQLSDNKIHNRRFCLLHCAGEARLVRRGATSCVRGAPRALRSHGRGNSCRTCVNPIYHIQEC